MTADIAREMPGEEAGPAAKGRAEPPAAAPPAPAVEAERPAQWRDRAEQAWAARAWEQAVPLYTLALGEWEAGASGGGTSASRYELLDRRAECYRHVGNFAAEAADLAVMAEMDAAAARAAAGGAGRDATASDAIGREIDVLVRHVFSMRWGGNYAEGRRLAAAAIALAREAGDRAREGHALTAIARMLAAMGENAAALANVERALSLSRQAGDVAGEARGMWMLGIVLLNLGRTEEAEVAVEAALPLFRRLEDREGEADCLNVLAGAVTDMARQRTWHYRSLALYEELGHRPGQALAATDLNVLYYHLGLYGRAAEYGEQSRSIAEAAGLRGMLAFSLDNLGMACAALGQQDRARSLFEQAQATARENGDQFVETGCALDLAGLDLATGRAAEARARLGEVAARLRELDIPLLVPALARLGAAHLALGDTGAALDATAEAAALLERGQRSVDYLPQEVYWWRYRALKAAEGHSRTPCLRPGQVDTKTHGGPEERGGEEEAWGALERAREEMLGGIASLSDEGLRRNYLNKVAINRAIIHEWFAEARKRDPAARLFAGSKGAEQTARWDQFSRLVDIGVRLNAQRDPAGLPRFIMDEVVELSGAERAALVLLEGTAQTTALSETGRGAPYVAAQSAPADRDISPAEVESLLDGVRRRRAALLAYEPQAGPGGGDEEAAAAEVDQLSVIVVPLIAGGEFAGWLYADLPGCFGRFVDQDRDLLALLANQATVALQNANWAAKLQRRVAERTAELTIVNTVQQKLASHLDDQAIFDLVGESLREIFEAQAVIVVAYDEVAGMMHFRYHWEKGRRYYPESTPLSPLARHIIRTRETILINEDAVRRKQQYGVRQIPGTEAAKSLLFVPLIVGGRVLGNISLQDIDREHAFSEPDARLLSTLAASMSVALDNARLFEQGKRLLADSEQRATELDMLADIGRALSSTLDITALPELVYQQVRRVMYAENLIIALYDPAGHQVEFVYSHNPDEVAIGTRRSADAGLTGQIVRTRRSIFLHGDIAAGARAMGLEVIGPPAASWLGVPMVLGDRVLGALIVQHYTDTAAYDDSHVTLLEAVASQAAVAVENARLYTEAERQRQRSESVTRRLADIVSFLPDATFVIDSSGVVIEWNRAMEDMTGTRAVEILGQGDYAYAVPFYGKRRPILIDLVLQPAEEIERKYASIQRQGETLVGESLVPSLRGRERYLYATASLLRDAEGRPAGGIEVIRDITERKQMEDDLREAKTAAEAATQAKSAFLAMMSHEIRTPMNAIIGMSGLLMDTPLSAEQHEFAETIRSSGDALLTIINDILDFSKIEAGKMELEEQPFDLRECVESSLDLLRMKAAEKKLELACEIDADVPPAIWGDLTRLRQILVNLLSNAVKFTDEGEVVLTVGTGEGGWGVGAGPHPPSPFPGSVRLHFAVRDTGIGIAPDRLDRLFQAFSQADASTSRKYGGTGLGLVVSKRLTEMMGGRLWVESPAPLPENLPAERGPSDPGGAWLPTGFGSDGLAQAGGGPGSIFHFTIVARPAPELKAQARLTLEAPQLRGKRVLIVDDNATNGRILALQVRAWGMAPRETGSPLLALEWLRAGDPFDAAILDMHMPEMDGAALAAAIRELERKRHENGGGLPLLLLSSLGRMEAGPDTAPFAACLTKPVRPSALFDALMGAVAGGPSGAEDGEARPEAVEPARGRPAPQGAQPIKPGRDPETAARHPLRILLAEDNVVNQKLALRLLSQMGYRADVAANGIETLQAVERQAYDVILMDVQMPEMDGLEASRRICARWARGRRPRIIAMTANAMQGDRELCLEAGMDDYLSKPIRVEELAAALAASQALTSPLAGDFPTERVEPD